MHRTRKKQGHVKCSSGLGIGSLPLLEGKTIRVATQLPLQTCPVISEIRHQTLYKMQFRLLSHCNRTSFAIEFHPNREQWLKRNLADNTIATNSNLTLLSDINRVKFAPSLKHRRSACNQPIGRRFQMAFAFAVSEIQ